MAKSKLEVDDLESITDPVDTASVHAVVTQLSPVKKGCYSEFFKGNVSDGLVGFKKSHQTKLKQKMEDKEPIRIDDCQIKPAKRGNKQVRHITQKFHQNSEVTQKNLY